MADLLRVGAVAKLEDRPDAVLPVTADEEEIGEVERDRRDGRLVPVRLELFVDLAGDDGRVERFDSIHVNGVDFTAPHGPANRAVAVEVVDQNLDRLHEHLVAEGHAVPVDALERVHCELVLDDAVRVRLSER